MVAVSADPRSARVVIVDNSADSREVFHTLLQQRGVTSLEVRHAQEGLDAIRQHRPEVVILDLDSDVIGEAGMREQFDSAMRESRAALVVLGDSGSYRKDLPVDQMIAKPYHYEPLLRTIERLLMR